MSATNDGNSSVLGVTVDPSIDVQLRGMARPNRRVGVKYSGACWVTVVELDGTFMEWILYDGEQIIARDNTSMELLEPVYARELFLEVTSDETVQYSITVTKAKDL
jgi:hypothetical protein